MFSLKKRVAKLLAIVGCCFGISSALAEAAAETTVEAPGPAGFLQGRMLKPYIWKGPVVLIIPGSGPTDRDGNSPAGIKASTYRLLAEGLADKGVTTVRIDKRGMFASAAATPDPNAVTIADYAADVHSWTAVVRAKTGASCVWLLGHSEGGLVAMVAAQSQPDICGLVLVAAAGRPLGAVLREQLNANPANAPILKQAMAAIDSLEKGKTFDTTDMHPALMGLFRPQVQGFLMNAFSYDPAKLLTGYQKPVLVLQGQRDLQVQEADARLLKQSAPKATLVLLPEANHALKAVHSEDRLANFATYADANLPLAPGAVDAIATFCQTHSPGL